VSKRLEDRLAFHAFVLCHGTEDGVQRSDAEGLVGRNGETLVRGFFGLQHDVAAFLMDDATAPTTAKGLNKVVPAEVAWDPHEFARTSSRTR
jgi:hypothetical protein